MGLAAALRSRARHLLLWTLALTVVVVAVVQTSTVLGQVATGATLTVIRGTTSVVRGDGSAVQPAATGLTLNAGDRIATIGRGSALVTFFDGTEVELGENTTIRIQETESRPGGQITIVLENVLGSTLHKVATLTNPGSSYEIVSGGSVALVRGTTAIFRTDDQGNVTFYLIEASNVVNFPYPGNRIYPGQICTHTAQGDVFCSTAKGGDPWGEAANGVNAGSANEKPKSSPKEDDVVTVTTATITESTSTHASTFVGPTTSFSTSTSASTSASTSSGGTTRPGPGF